jgi:hypothetical protein
MNMRSSVRVTALAAVSLIAIVQVSAGVRVSSAVVIDSTNRWAKGSLGTARNSADNTQYIGCTVYNNTPPSATCIARNDDGQFASCTTSSAEHVQGARSLGSDSFLQFVWDANGICTAITITHNSYYEPKQ